MISPEITLPCSCAPVQILTVPTAINDISEIEITGKDGTTYNLESLTFGYSVDGVCWSCWVNWSDLVSLTSGVSSDWYIRVKIPGPITKVTINDTEVSDWRTSFDTEIKVDACSTNPNRFSPYDNMECAVALQQALTENIACIFGIPIYYFKLAGNTKSKDITFKEYTLYDVESVKQIKLIINDGTMPSSKPTFSELGFDWETDWDTEISKGMFATAFGTAAQPTEGDLIYIPMMKRMWMVNEAYEEKKDSLMWMATTFHVMLVKYEEKGSVSLGDVGSLVDSFVKNKYDDLFGDTENDDSGVDAVDVTLPMSDNLYPVYESDATRKWVTCTNTEIKNVSLYNRGTLVSDRCYDLSAGPNAMVVYQKQYCGCDGTISFIVSLSPGDYAGSVVSIGNIKVKISQTPTDVVVSMGSLSVKLTPGNTYLIYVRWSHQLNICQMGAAKYSYPSNIPLYRVQNHMFYFDFKNQISSVGKWDTEMLVESPVDVTFGKVLGTQTNFKLWTEYIDDVSEIMMMYPTDQRLLINDTARNLIDGLGTTI